MSEPEDKYQQTHKAWNALAERYRDGFNGLSIYEETYEEFCKLCKGPDLLEIGCGPATITNRLALLRPDFNILATDVSMSMLMETKKILPAVEVMQLDARHLEEIRRTFDGAVCGFVLPYLDEQDARKFLVDIGKLLVPSGIFYLSYVPAPVYKEITQTSSDGQHSMMFHYYTDEQIANWSGMAGLRILETFSVEYHRPTGEREIHRVIIFKKRSSIA